MIFNFLLVVLLDDSGEQIVIGIVASILIITILAIKESGITSKKGRERGRITKQLKKLSEDLNELENLHRQGVLTKNELINKSINLEKKKIELMIDLRLNDDEEYKTLLKAYQNGYITESEKTEKIDLIIRRIKRDI